jgi:hypothetical protein
MLKAIYFAKIDGEASGILPCYAGKVLRSKKLAAHQIHRRMPLRLGFLTVTLDLLNYWAEQNRDTDAVIRYAQALPNGERVSKELL